MSTPPRWTKEPLNPDRPWLREAIAAGLIDRQEPTVSLVKDEASGYWGENR